VQSVEGPSLEKPGNRGAPPFDQQPSIPVVAKHPHEEDRVEPVGRDWQSEHVGIGTRGRRADVVFGASNNNRVGLSVGEDVSILVESSLRVQDNPGWVVTLDLSHREARIVRFDRARTHYDRVDEGPEAMESSQVGRSGDVVRVPRGRGDAPVDALTRLSDDQIGLPLNWQQDFEQIPRVVGDVSRNRPLTRREDLQPDIRMGIMLNAHRGVWDAPR
jgi:hypothetical protein